MNDEIERLAGAVRREVLTLDRDGKPAKVIRAGRDYATNPDEVWDALTNRARIPRWLLPVSGDLRLGGRYQLEGNAGGTITECDPPRRLGATWEFGGHVSWVAVTLSGAGADCAHLELEHVAHVPAEEWDRFGPGAVGVGWDLALMGLARHLGAPTASMEAGQADEWAKSDEGRGFMRLIAGKWGEAAIAGGDDRLKALEAAARTAQAYAGEENDAG